MPLRKKEFFISIWGVWVKRTFFVRLPLPFRYFSTLFNVFSYRLLCALGRYTVPGEVIDSFTITDITPKRFSIGQFAIWAPFLAEQIQSMQCDTIRPTQFENWHFLRALYNLWTTRLEKSLTNKNFCYTRIVMSRSFQKMRSLLQKL